MSTTIIYGARVTKTSTGGIAIEAKSRANNLIPNEGKHSDGLSWETWKIFEEGLDAEEIAAWMEGLAADYDGSCIREGSIDGERGRFTGPAAYDLWAARYRRATGCSLRAPRLDHVTWSGIPPYLVSPPKPRVRVRAGDLLSPLDAAKLIEAEVSLRVQDAANIPMRLGFIRDGRPCAYGFRQRRRGFYITGAVTALEGYDSWAHCPGIERADAILSDADQNTPGAWFVFGRSRDKEVVMVQDHPFFGWDFHPHGRGTKVAGFTDRAAAERAAEIIGQAMPHCKVHVADGDMIPADYFEMVEA
jgi:hypothetical protein